MGRRTDSRQADGRPAGWQGTEREPRAPSQAAPDRDELPAHPIPSPGQERPGREQATFPRCDGSAAQAPLSVLVATYSTWNPQPNLRTPALPGEGPSGALEPKLPRLLSPWFAPSLDPSIHPSIHPARPPACPVSQASIVTPRRIGTGQTGRDRARWSGPCPVSDHAPVREKDETVGWLFSREPTRGCTLAG